LRAVIATARRGAVRHRFSARRSKAFLTGLPADDPSPAASRPTGSRPSAPIITSIVSSIPEGSTAPVAADHLLDHRIVSPEAGARLTRFEAFIKDESKRLESEAKDADDAAVGDLTKARISRSDLTEMIRFVADELGDDDLAAALRRSMVVNRWRLRQISRRHGGQPLPRYRDAEPTPSAAIAVQLANLSRRIAAMTAEADAPERRAMVVERDALADRQWLATIEGKT
jgi:hypothetical protein